MRNNVAYAIDENGFWIEGSWVCIDVILVRQVIHLTLFFVPKGKNVQEQVTSVHFIPTTATAPL